MVTKINIPFVHFSSYIPRQFNYVIFQKSTKTTRRHQSIFYQRKSFQIQMLDHPVFFFIIGNFGHEKGNF